MLSRCQNIDREWWVLVDYSCCDDWMWFLFEVASLLMLSPACPCVKIITRVFPVMSRYLSQSGGLVQLSHRYTGAEQPLSLPISSDYKSEVSGVLGYGWTAVYITVTLPNRINNSWFKGWFAILILLCFLNFLKAFSSNERAVECCLVTPPQLPVMRSVGQRAVVLVTLLPFHVPRPHRSPHFLIGAFHAD